jgi:hypothetical protein
MGQPEISGGYLLKDNATLNSSKVINPDSLTCFGGINTNSPVLVNLVAGKGTRFGTEPKCIQPVSGTPLARHSIDSFHRFIHSPSICVVGYRHNEVSVALGDDNIYVLSANSTGGTAFAAFEALSVPGLLDQNPLLVITMGDRIVPSSTFRHLWKTHFSNSGEADLTFLTAIYEPPKNRGKGRVIRDEKGKVLRIIEEREILEMNDELARQSLVNITEGNCPLYCIRALTLHRYLQDLKNENAQNQYYLTDIIELISKAGGEVKTITTKVNDPEYDLLCSDVTQPMDLALLEGILASSRGLMVPDEIEVEEAAETIITGRPAGQIASIARQLDELIEMIRQEKLMFDSERPIGIGISGGRLRIAFMHPDVVRFYGPAWQMPIGAGDSSGEEQIIVLLQEADDGRIHLFPRNPLYRESINSVPADYGAMYPGEEVSDIHAYEKFGTNMSEGLLLSLGYFSEKELEFRRSGGHPLPPPSLWVSSNLRRPFALIGNAIASLRTLRTGNLGAKVSKCLGKENFRGLRLASTGNIPQGGFSSSSAVTVATKNALNSLYNLGISSDLLVHLACQAEYGTGVRAGSLDQATEQKGRAGKGTLISSNPKDNYRIIGTYPIPHDRIQIIFPYSVARDRAAWLWSWGVYGGLENSGPLTTMEIRKMTGKAAEIAALILQLPLETDLFKVIEDDIVANGLLSDSNKRWICSLLLRLPVLIRKNELLLEVDSRRDWYVQQLMEHDKLDYNSALHKADETIKLLFEGWRDPVLKRASPTGVISEEEGIPLRAIIAYLFGEVAKNFFLIHNPDQWISQVSLSQLGDCSFDIPVEGLPSREEMENGLEWEKGISGPELLGKWMEKFNAKPFDFNKGLDDTTLSGNDPPEFHRLEGSNFFRGLALIDLAGAMLKKAFGIDSVAVRVNAAGQGDYFQVHIDTYRADPEDVKQFLRMAFYRRFGFSPAKEFVEIHAGGSAAGINLSRFRSLPLLTERLHLYTGTLNN